VGGRITFTVIRGSGARCWSYLATWTGLTLLLSSYILVGSKGTFLTELIGRVGLLPLSTVLWEQETNHKIRVILITHQDSYPSTQYSAIDPFIQRPP